MAVLIQDQKNELIKIIRSETFQANTEIKARVFESLSVLFHQITDREQQELINLVAQRLDWPKDRIRPVMAMESGIDLRRAVEWQPRQPRRSQDETLFPAEGWIGGYLLYAQENESPLAWHFWSAVALVGAACQRHLYIDRGAYTVWPNYYTILVGPSGSGKSTAIHMAVDVLHRANLILEANDKWPADRRIRILPETITPVGLLRELKTGKVMDTTKGLILEERWKSSIGFLANDEMTTLLGRSNYQSSRMVQILTALYQCPETWRDMAYMRGELELRDVAFSMLMGTAPDWLRDDVTDAMLKGGFMNRCHFSYRPRTENYHSKPGTNDPIVANALAYGLTKLIQAPFCGMTITDDAEKFYDDWYTKTKIEIDTVDIMLENTYIRKPAHLLKLSMVLAISRDLDNRIITKEDMEAALRILDYEQRFLPEMLNEIGSSAESRKEDLVLAVIQKQPVWISRKNLGNLVYKKVNGASNLDKILNSLRRRGVIESRRGKWKQVFYRVVKGTEATSDPPQG